MVNVASLSGEYRRRFPGSEPAVIARAPGRVNLIGEHVDYNGGLVMPFAMPLATWAIAGKRGDDHVIAQSVQSLEVIEFEIHSIGAPSIGWGAYVQGVVAELHSRGLPQFGMNVLIDSDIPTGAGLSSSAALESAIALAVLELASQTLPRDEIAAACRQAEHDYAGVPCGIMDQKACLCCCADNVTLLDCRDHSMQHIPWPRGDVIIVVVDSRSPHRLSTGTYALRVKECERAVTALRSIKVESSLRDASLGELENIRSHVDATVFSRARHVVSEVERVRRAADALRQSDFASLGTLMNESHRSLAIDYGVSTPQLDVLASCVREVDGVYGARLTGAGFGGCVVAIAERSIVPDIEAAVRRDYDPRFSVTAPVWMWHPSEGATVQRLDT